MKRPLLQLHRLLALVFVVLATTAKAEPFSPSPATQAQFEAIKQGGYVLFIRHGPTDSSQPDQVPVDLNDCTTQRPLSDTGREIMQRVGQYFHQSAIPFDKVYSSPLCRAYETSEILFGQGGYEVDPNLLYVAALTSDEKKPIVARTQELLSTPTAADTNRILVAHGPNMVEVMEYFPVEGTLVIIRPHADGSGFDYIASIEPDHWANLLDTAE